MEVNPIGRCGWQSCFERMVAEIHQLKLNRSGDRVALKKPLLLLYVIALFERDGLGTNVIRFSDIKTPLDQLIRSFGGRATLHGAKPEQPFFHMASSRIWKLHEIPEAYRESRKRTPSAKDLDLAWASLDDDMFELLRSHPGVRTQLVDVILNKWWPESVHGDIRAALQLSEASLEVDGITHSRRPRSSRFQLEVLRNYRHRCAFCGFSTLFNSMPFGVDAAHIRWHTEMGPDDLDNGLALCKVHHWAFDRGALSITEDMRILVSPHLVAQDQVGISLLESLSERNISAGREPPHERHLQWHRKNIFLG